MSTSHHASHHPSHSEGSDSEGDDHSPTSGQSQPFSSPELPSVLPSYPTAPAAAAAAAPVSHARPTPPSSASAVTSAAHTARVSTPATAGIIPLWHAPSTTHHTHARAAGQPPTSQHHPTAGIASQSRYAQEARYTHEEPMEGSQEEVGLPPSPLSITDVEATLPPPQGSPRSGPSHHHHHHHHPHQSLQHTAPAPAPGAMYPPHRLTPAAAAAASVHGRGPDCFC